MSGESGISDGLPWNRSEPRNASQHDDVDWFEYTPEQLEDARFAQLLMTVVTPALFAAIVVIGTVGNALVIHVILSRRSMRTPTNLLLLNLAVADIAFLLVCVSFNGYKFYADTWPFGDRFCKLVQYLLYVTAYVTVYTLVAISAVRFFAIVYPFSTKRYRTCRNMWLLNAGVWTTMLTVNVPTLLVHQNKTFGAYTYCGMRAGAVRPVFASFFAFAYALPLALICLLYLRIVVHLRRAAGGGAVSDGSRERTARASRVVVIVVVVFGVSWLPSHVNSLLALFSALPDSRFYQVCRVLWYCLAYGNSCANPIIYSYASQDFRRCFREVVCRWCVDAPADRCPSTTTTEMARMIAHNPDGNSKRGEAHERGDSLTSQS